MLVSHDRRCCAPPATVCGWWPTGACAFDGDLDDYRDWLRQREAGGAAARAGRGDAQAAKARREAEARNRRYAQKRPLAQRLAKLERRMAELERERALLGKWLSDPESYADANKFKVELAREGKLAAELTKAEEEWLALQAELETLA